MKKIIFILLSFILFVSCSSDSNSCNNEVWATHKSCPTQTTCTYTITFGPNDTDTQTIVTNAATYNYYNAKIEAEQEVICWEGEK